MRVRRKLWSPGERGRRQLALLSWPMPGDERKLVTVLFADVAGSTELVTRHDAEALRALLSAFFQEMRQRIEAFDGTVEKFAGDAVMAVFGVPTIHEDDAERAVRAAVAMRDAMAELNPLFEQEYGVRLTLRIGVATGEAVAASRPAREFLVTGEVPNLAARLQSIADPIAISEETYRPLMPLLEAQRTGPHVLKGFERPVTAWQSTHRASPRAGRGGFRDLARPSSVGIASWRRCGTASRACAAAAARS